MTFPEYLDSIDLMSVYTRKILPKRGGGRDNVSPEIYKKTLEKEIDWLRDKLADGSYRFSPYKEKLVLKGKGKPPRVLSLPSVRDRLVLTVLNGYISSETRSTNMIPNQYIRKIQEYITQARKANNDIYFFKTDIASFYDNINHSVLISVLSDKIDGIALKLIVKAITTPTISDATDRFIINKIGVPQGLSISNILSTIYVSAFHEDMRRTFNDGLFLRYVDDIIVLTTQQVDAKNIIIDGIARHNLNLKLTESKTFSGRIEDGFEYIGYSIKDSKISVKKKNKDNFSNRLVKRCTLFKKQFEDSSLRPRFAVNDSEFIEYAKTDLNLMISGFKVNNHNYGWISYFQRINDLTLLHQLDRLIKNSLGKNLYDFLSLNSLVSTYHSLKDNSSENLLIDFDAVTNRGSNV